MEPFKYLAILFVLVAPVFMQFEEPDYNEIVELQTSTHSSIIYDRIDIIEGDLEVLIKRLDELARTDRNKLYEIISHISNHSIDLRTMSRYTIAPQCGSSIAESEFDRARDILSKVFQDDYDEVVRAAFHKKPENFRNVLRFADTVYNRKKNNTLRLYDELYKRAKINRHTNVDDYINMYDNMKIRYISDDWNTLKQAVLNSIVEKFAIMLTSNGNSYNSAYSIPRLQTVYNLDIDAGRNLMSKIIGKLYNKHNLESLIKYVHEQQNLPLREQGFQKIFEMMTRSGDLSSHYLFYLGTMIRMTLRAPSLDAATKTQLLHIRDRFPRSIKEAALSWQVCIQNKKSNNYLKVSDNNKAGEWRVLVSPGETTYDRTKWRFEAMHNGIYVMLKNIYMNRNVMKMSADVWTGNGYGKKVGISLPMNTGDNWLLEADSDYVRIRSKTDESKYLRDFEGGVVFTSVKDDYALWSVESC